MSQKDFDNMYDEGIEQNKISLTDSETITTGDLLDAVIYRLYFKEGYQDLKEIEKILNERLKIFKNDLKSLL